MRENGKLYGAAFVQIGGNNDMDLTAISVTGYDREEGTSGDVVVQILDSLGRTEKAYFWQDYTKKGKTYLGWQDEEDEFIEVGDVVVKAGSGLWVVAPNADFKLCSNGQVMTDPLTVTLRENGLLVANPYPMAIDLTKVWGSGYDTEEGTSSDIVVQTLDSLGRTEKAYFWQDYTKKGKTYYGWQDEEDEFIEEGALVINPSDALNVIAPNSDFKINFPGILEGEVSK